MRNLKRHQPAHWVAVAPLHKEDGDVLWSNDNEAMSIVTEGELWALLHAFVDSNNRCSEGAVENIEKMLQAVQEVDMVIERMIKTV